MIAGDYFVLQFYCNADMTRASSIFRKPQSANRKPSPPASLAERLHAVQKSLFVGRAAERELFQTAIAAKELPFSVLHVFGPGGVGKTSLLHEFAALCEAAGIEAVVFDARGIEPAPDTFLAALSEALQPLGLPASGAPLEFLAGSSRRRVLLIDTYELLAPLDDWLREEFLPQLSANVLVVLAGRYPPSRAWRVHSGWQRLVRTLSLRNLTPEESRAYLRRRAVPAAQHAAVLSFTNGHPLALSLVADLFDQNNSMARGAPGRAGGSRAERRRDEETEEFRFDPAAAPDVVQVLVEHLVQKVPGPAHRAALEVCALVRLTTEALLEEMLSPAQTDPAPPGGLASSASRDGASAREVFEWLRALSFIEAERGGVFPHDLARQALIADLRWRNPDRYADLHRRAHNYYATRYAASLQQGPEDAPLQEPGRILFDYIFLHCSNPVVRSFLEWQDMGSLTCGPAREAEKPDLLAMVARHEGEESARLAAAWFAHSACQSTTLRDGDGGARGFIARVALHQAAPEDLEADAGTRAAWRYLQKQAPLRPGEDATLFRFWMARDDYQSISPEQSLIFIAIVRHFLSTPNLAFTFLACADPDFWEPALTYVETERLRSADFNVGGRRYGMYGHDWRAMPPPQWMAALAEREMAASAEMDLPPLADASSSDAPSFVALSRPAFDAAVRDALRNFTRPAALRANVLLQSRLVAERSSGAGNSERVAALQTLLREACETLRDAPRDAKFYNALHHAYLHPASSREQAAELLDVPLGTFRRHLKAGVAHVRDILWQREVEG